MNKRKQTKSPYSSAAGTFRKERVGALALLQIGRKRVHYFGAHSISSGTSAADVGPSQAPNMAEPKAATVVMTGRTTEHARSKQ